MKQELIADLQCLHCRFSHWELSIHVENSREVREGELICKSCGRIYPITRGILNTLSSELPEEAAHEKEHAESLGYLVSETGERHAINEETIRRFKHLFLSLPEGDGSAFFQPGGSFDNQAGNADRFFQTLDFLKLTGKERILEVGASFGWASWRLAQRGCRVVALDITDYLITADLYFDEGDVYYDRLMADMSRLPFRDESLDLIFSHSVIHHCKDLPKLFREFHRVLRPGGRVVALHECAFGIFEDKSDAPLKEAIHEGFNENAFTLPEWKRGAKQGGFRKVQFHFFSFIRDYIYRKELRKAPRNFKLSLACWISFQPRLERFLNFLSTFPRILLRPKAWMMIATK